MNAQPKDESAGLARGENTQCRGPRAMSVRKRGRRTKSFDGIPTAKVLKGAKCLLYADFGGKDPVKVVQAKARAKGVDLGPKSTALVLEVIKEQLDAMRARVFPLIDQAVESLEEPPPAVTERSE